MGQHWWHPSVVIKPPNVNVPSPLLVLKLPLIQSSNDVEYCKKYVVRDVDDYVDNHVDDVVTITTRYVAR